MTNDERPILIADDGGVRTITLNRPQTLNALNAPLLEALVAALTDAEHEPGVRCLVMTGAGRAFCSGQDLGVVRDRYQSGDPIEFGDLLRTLYNPVILRMRTMEKPIIASVNGAAAGAGCSLAVACDLRIAAESASFMLAFINVGLVPDAGCTFMLPRLIGVSRTMEMACTGRKVLAAEAQAIGLVNQVVPDQELAPATRTLAQKLAAMPTRAIGLAKRGIDAAWTADLADQLDREAALQSRACRSTDHREGVEAFLGKRPPRFLGR